MNAANGEAAGRVEAKVDSRLENQGERFGSGRGVTATTVGMFVPVFAIWLIASIFALMPIGLLLGAIAGNATAGAYVCWLGWTFGAVLVFLRPVEERVSHMIFGVRKPTSAEVDTLKPLWDGICDSAKIDSRRYLLRIEDQPSLNAHAAAGHLVTVTRGAMQLPHDMLQGILAHELGHHRDLHPVASLLTWWFLLPIGLLDWCLRIIVRATAFVLQFFEGWLIFFLAIVVLSLLAARFFFFIPVKLAEFFGLIMGRAGEYRADRHAVDMGYGPGLLAALQYFLDQGFDDGAPTGIAGLYNTHPPLHKRIAAIDKRIAQAAGAA
ncbi:MAG TPA: M48 family metalloprotease [Solirubrobacterales bacterium]|nr:M48 family metalloprotease [Solirubrobacterales bacterium]